MLYTRETILDVLHRYLDACIINFNIHFCSGVQFIFLLQSTIYFTIFNGNFKTYHFISETVQ